MSLRKWITGSVAVAGLLFAAAAHAKPPKSGFYVGGTTGQSKFDDDLGGMDSILFDAFRSVGLSITGVNSDLDDSDNNFSVFGGYRFFPYLAAEFGYVDLGELAYSADFVVLRPGAPLPGAVKITFGSKGPVASALGIWPVNDSWDLYARAGLFVSDTELSVKVNALGVSETVTESKTAVDPMIGLGTAVHLGKHFSLRAEYQRFGSVGDEDSTGEMHVDLVNVGFLVQF
jgi:OmpA-OmpF porin, OOP family